jgi:hypothetical protein
MKTEAVKDYGQELPPPDGHVFGFVDSQDALRELSAALNRSGFDDSKLMILEGEDGVKLLNRLYEKFYFSDPEYQMIVHGIKQLKAGQLCVSIAVESRDEALGIANLARPFGGHDFQYLGTWISESF